MREWAQWWDENRRGYKVSPKEAPLPKKLARSWDRVWKVPSEESNGKKDKGQSEDGEGADEKGEGNKRRKRRRDRKKGNGGSR